MGEKRLRAFLPHDPLQHRAGNLREVGEHQPVERFAKLGIDAEAKQSGVQVQILAEEHRNRFTVGLDRADKTRYRFQAVHRHDVCQTLARGRTP
jgi:hypothetical protein